MSKVWYCIPSKRPASEAQRCVDAWRDMGYKVALWVDSERNAPTFDFMATNDCSILRPHLTAQYPGYAVAVNSLIRGLIEGVALDGLQEIDYFVTGGDDVFPDPTKRADEIADELTAHFGGTFGVMQPTGGGRGIDTICGSPWMGREFCELAYGGNGPLYEGYFHNHVDNELQEVAIKLGCFWQRPDLTHRHDHWTWTTGQMPEFLQRANSRAEWDKSQRLFLNRKAAGFPGHEPLPVAVTA